MITYIDELLWVLHGLNRIISPYPCVQLYGFTKAVYTSHSNGRQCTTKRAFTIRGGCSSQLEPSL